MMKIKILNYVEYSIYKIYVGTYIVQRYYTYILTFNIFILIQINEK